MESNAVTASSGQVSLEASPQEWKEAREWLETYGYVANKVQLTPEEMAAALRSAQGFGGIPVTGEYDAATKALFKQDRCGNLDRRTPAAGPAGPPKFVLWGNSKRDHLNLRYGLADFSKHKSQQECRDVVRNALYYWSSVAPFTFTEDNSGQPVDILFRWGQGLQHLNCPFDFRAGTNAHATPLGPGPSPQTDVSGFSGQIHFADDKIKNWTNERMMATTVHEVGHALGLDHSYVARAWMKSSANVDLHYDDIAGLRAMYDPLCPQLAAAGENLYQLLPNGLIYQRLSAPRNGWTIIDDNPMNGQIVGSEAGLFLIHYIQRGNARVYRFSGTPRKWDRIAEFVDSRNIAATAKTLFLWRQDSNPPIWRWKGKGQEWAGIDLEAIYLNNIVGLAACSDDPSMRVFLRGDYGRVWLLRLADDGSSPTLEEYWMPPPDDEGRWVEQMAFSDQSLYLRLRSGTIMHLLDVNADAAHREWITVDQDPKNVDIACASGLLVFRRSDDTLWRYLGIGTVSAMVEMMDADTRSLSVAALASGALFVVRRGGEVWRALS